MSILVGLIVGVFFGVIARLIPGRWWPIPLFVIANVLYTWFSLPTLKYGFSDIPILFLVNSAALLGVAYVTSKKPSFTKLKTGPLYIMTALSLFAVLVVPFFTSFAGLHAQKYYELAGNVSVGEFSEDISAIEKIFRQ